MRRGENKLTSKFLPAPMPRTIPPEGEMLMMADRDTHYDRDGVHVNIRREER